MTPALDARQRAMLTEMGIHCYEPIAPPGMTDPQPQRPARDPAPAASRRVNADASPLPAERVHAEAGAVPPPAGAVELMEWDALARAVAQCRACRLCEGRRNTVFGVGDAQADWLIVGEAPGENEDLQGEPFVGQAGKLLDNMLAALGLDRHRNVYIANVLKCRPPANRNPAPEEVARCEPFLRRQVQLLQPRMILAMGRFAVHSLLGTAEPIGKLRGRVHSYREVPVVVTYHPAYLLRNPADKAKAWEDLCLAMDSMSRQPG
jgi:DNA polymerase